MRRGLAEVYTGPHNCKRLLYAYTAHGTTIGTTAMEFITSLTETAMSAAGNAGYGGSETQKRVWECLGSEKWGASSTMMMPIAQETFIYECYNEVGWWVCVCYRRLERLPCQPHAAAACTKCAAKLLHAR